MPSLELGITGLGAALVAGALAGVAPAWYAARLDIVPALRSG